LIEARDGMRELLAIATGLACLVLTPVTAVGGVDPFPIDALMDMVDEETRAQTPTSPATGRFARPPTEPSSPRR